MSTEISHKKARAVKMTAQEKKAAQMAANRKARLQWYILAAVVTAIVIGAIIVVLILTDGEIGTGHSN